MGKRYVVIEEDDGKPGCLHKIVGTILLILVLLAIFSVMGKR